MGKLLILWLLVATTTAKRINQIECPFPEGQSVSSEQECAKYTACEWTEGVCHMKNNEEAGYVVNSSPYDTVGGFKIDLKKSQSNVTMFEGDIDELVFEAIYHEMFHVQIKIYDKNNSRYEVPVPLNLPEKPTEFPEYQVNVSEINQPFQFNVSRKMNVVNVFRSIGPLTYENQFLQIHTSLASTYLYGLGENVHSKLRHTFQPRQTYPIFTASHVLEEGYTNQYGHHPYYLVIENDEGYSHSLFFQNSNAMEYSTYLLDDGTPALTLRSIGGIIDFHIFLGEEPADVYTHYANAIWNSFMPPYWALGFHLSRWGYNSTDDVRNLRKRMKDNGIPQDVQYFDIDYMENLRDFTYNQTHWKDLPELVKELKEDNLHTVFILDPVIATDFKNYGPATRGKAADAFIKWQFPEYVPSDQPEGAGEYVVGTTWNRPVVFPDFLKNSTQNWWTGELKTFYQSVPFDGLWLDENEPVNYNTLTTLSQRSSANKRIEKNSLSAIDEYLEESYSEAAGYLLHCPNTSALNNPPYPTMLTRVGNSITHKLSENTICMSSNQTVFNKTVQHYDFHSLFGLSETYATSQALQEVLPGKRSFILTRSTYPGSGALAAHWTGDNKAEWEQMRMSIITMIEFGMFNVPMVGADICGFYGTPDMELCARWMQLGAFYPFSRNHNSNQSPDQDPTAWPEVAAISKHWLEFRYLLLPYLYTQFFEAHAFGLPVIHPMFVEFYFDLYARDIDDQFLWGSALMIAPVLEKGATNRTVYLPEGEWYSLEGKKYSGPLNTTVDAPLEEIPIFLRAGFIIPAQRPAENTFLSRQQPFGLFVIPRGANNATQGRFAQGFQYYDEGDGPVNGTVIKYQFLQDTLTNRHDHLAQILAGQKLGFITFFAMTTAPSSVVLNSNPLPADQWKYEADKQMLSVDVDLQMSDTFTLDLKYKQRSE